MVDQVESEPFSTAEFRQHAEYVSMSALAIWRLSRLK
jgi:hypothetical protein